MVSNIHRNVRLIKRVNREFQSAEIDIFCGEIYCVSKLFVKIEEYEIPHNMLLKNDKISFELEIVDPKFRKIMKLETFECN